MNILVSLPVAGWLCVGVGMTNLEMCVSLGAAARIWTVGLGHAHVRIGELN